MTQYLELLRHVLEHGKFRTDRTGTGTYAVFGSQARFPLAEGFPLLTTKKLHVKSIIYELLWFLRGDTNVKYLHEHGVTIWDEWADKDGSLGPIYGAQWCRWRTPDGSSINQIDQVIEQIKKQPDSRRLIVSAWNVGELDQMALAPCHALFQFFVQEGELHCQLYQRSADIFLGVPFNIASYALLTMMVAQVCKLKPGTFVHTFGDLHLYANHLEQARLQLTREPRSLPWMKLNPAVKNIHDFKYADFELSDYNPYPGIKAPIARVKPFKAIAAMSLNRVIGAGNRIPWHLPEDFKWFKQMTTGNVIVMGRKTFESIGKPLPNRETIVLTRSPAPMPGVRTISDLRELNPADPTLAGREIYICGGAQVYEQALPQCSDLYLTLVQREVEGDIYFPPFEDQFEPVGEILSHPEFKILHYRARSR